jgi:hypothetical protein
MALDHNYESDFNPAALPAKMNSGIERTVGQESE